MPDSRHPPPKDNIRPSQ